MGGFLESNKRAFFVAVVIMVSIYIYKILSTIMFLFVPRGLLHKRKDIRGKTILITGAGSGVGRQLAVEFSKFNTRLVLVDIDGQSLLHTKKLLDCRSKVFTYECDVSDYRKVREMAEKVKEEAGDVEILVNNAGIISGKYFNDLSDVEIARTMNVNAMAHMWTAKAFLPAMIERNSGHLVSIASVVGKVGIPRLVDYCASKYAAVGFAESLEIELRERKVDGIKLTIVYPSHIDTGLFDGAKMSVGTILTPEYVAKQVVLGVLEERESVFLPSFIDIAFASKECIPRWFAIKIAEWTGGIKGMEHFTGRQKKNGVNTPLKTDANDILKIHAESNGKF